MRDYRLRCVTQPTCLPIQLLGAMGDRQNMGNKKPTAIQKSNFSKWFKVFP